MTTLVSSVSSGSVLQKFKKTFFNKNGKTNVPAVENLEANETKHHRYVKHYSQNITSSRRTKVAALAQTKYLTMN